MKKYLALIVVLCICMSVCACNNREAKNKEIDYIDEKLNEISNEISNTDMILEDSNQSMSSASVDNTVETMTSNKKSSYEGNSKSSSQVSILQSETTSIQSSKQESSQISVQSKTEENESILSGITVKYVGKRLKTGDTLKNSDFEVIATYSDKKQIKVTDFSINITNLQKEGNNSVTVTYKNKSCSIIINVLEGNAPNANSGGEFGYEVNNGELTITTYVGAKTDVIVPAWIDDMPVTAIKGFSEKVTSVILPNSITRLERKAFYNCDQLVSVTLGPNIVEMGDNVFYHCEKLKDITIKKGATLIGDGMFSGCSSIEQITLPDSVIKIANNAFSNCQNLRILSIPSSVKEIGSYGVLSYCNKIEKIYVVEGSYAHRWGLNNGYGEKLVYN